MQLSEGASCLVVRAPDSFGEHLDGLSKPPRTTLRGKAKQDFVLGFMRDVATLQELAPKLVERVVDDGLLWLAYPKKSSPNLSSDITRDHGWGILGDLGFEPVRQIAIDADWSALRFRRVEYIAKLTRRTTMALSAEGKRRTKR